MQFQLDRNTQGIQSAASLVATVVCLLGLSFSAATQAKKYEESSPLDPIIQLIEKEKYDKAIPKLEKLLAKDQEDADVLSLLGFSYRKKKDYDTALKYYQQGLAVDPEHLANNEYLGQLYVETGQLDKARERLAVIDEACFFSCDEFESLQEAIDAATQ